MTNLKIIIGIIYILSPVDLIPEVILGPLGLLDDAGALVVVIKNIFKSIAKREAERRVHAFGGCLLRILKTLAIGAVIGGLVFLGIHFEVFTAVVHFCKTSFNSLLEFLKSILS